MPQTPENLLPYVAEEAYGVLNALKTSQISVETGEHIGPFLPGSLLSSQSPYILIEGLTFRLLWYIARTSYELMQLMSGIKARILPPGEQWQTGILRLAVILTAKASDFSSAEYPTRPIFTTRFSHRRTSQTQFLFADE